MPRRLEVLGAAVDVRALTRGDYVVGPETVVERKTVADLHSSIIRGRFWQQMDKIRAAGRSPWVIIEGPSLFTGPVGGNGIRGATLAVADLGITIVRTQDADDTAAWLYRLALRRHAGAVRNRPVYAQRPRSAVVIPAEAALAAAPGVSVVTARAVLARFGSLRGVCEADIEDLRRLPGVGLQRATAIVTLIHHPWNAVDTP